MSESNKDVTEQDKGEAKASQAAQGQGNQETKAAPTKKPEAKKVNTTTKAGDVDTVSLRDMNRKANEDGSFKGTPPTKDELARMAASKKHKLGAPVMVRTASGNEMYDPRSATWIDGRVSKVPMSNWLEAQIKAGKIIKE